MKNKKDSKKKQVIVSKHLYPEQINEISICCFIIKKDLHEALVKFILNNGGRILTSINCVGVQKSSIAQTIDGFLKNSYFVMAICQSEITDIFMDSIVKRFEINKHGKCFALDVLGYMGAKGPFVEW